MQVAALSNPSPALEQARDRLLAAGCAAIFVLQLWLIWAHVPWLDELQAYLLARDTHDLTGWWSNFRYEGHAPLWHLLIKLCTYVAPGPASLKLAQSLCAASIFTLIVWKCPWPWWGRLLLCSNYFLFFEYGVVARDYSLGVALTFAAVAFRQHWISWLFIALVPQAGMQFEMIAGLLVLMQWSDGQRSRAGAVLVGFGMVLAFAQMRPNPDFEAIGAMITQSRLWDRMLVSLRYAGTAVMPVDFDGQVLGWSDLKIPFQFLALVVAGALAPFIALLASRKLPLFAWGVPLFCLATYGLSIFAYSLSARHFGLVALVLVIGIWRHPSHLQANASARLWLVLLSLGGGLSLVQGVWKPFSSAPVVAERLRQPDIAGLPIIPVDTMLGVEPAAYLGVRTVNVTNQCWQSFIRWKGPVFLPPFEPLRQATSERKRQRGLEALEMLQRTTNRLGGVSVVILDRKAHELMSPLIEDALVPLAEFKDGIGPVHYRYLYLARTGASAERESLPNCRS